MRHRRLHVTGVVTRTAKSSGGTKTSTSKSSLGTETFSLVTNLSCRIHQLEHVRVHLRCQVPQCTHPGFDNNIDLVRHLQSAHGHSHQGPFKGYACAAEVCPKKDKVWLKAETYRSHCDRAHSEDDSEDLLERSRITLGYLDFGAAVRLCQLPSG